MKYSVTLRTSAAKELDNLPERTGKRIIQKLLVLENNPRPEGCKKLKGRETFRIRAGEYRILYQVKDKQKEVIIESIGHRKDIYR
jgi:mRNA interferase RelE/StbE